ncbi:hypothetical protein FQN49_002914 [Arthroderma sp. PD_2]|nr:hypothetical protein FQN49_002914 [Arthroderma sp. PD_2]
MLGSLPVIEPRDSHTLWYSSSHTDRSTPNSSQNGAPSGHHPQPARRNTRSPATTSPLFSASFDPLSALLSEERALRLRKQNIASFGYSWIRPAGFSKTMMGIREEEMECEEGVGAGVGEGDIEEEEFMEGIEGGDGGGMGLDGQGGDGEGEEGGDTGMERDLDGDIPDGDEEGFGLVEDGEEAYEEEEGEFLDEEEEGMMERDLDDDVPEALDSGGSDDDDDDEDEEDQTEDDEDEDGYDDDTSEVQTPPRRTPNMRTLGDSHMGRDLDGSVPDAQETPSQQQEWEHTDSDEDIYDDDDDDEEEDEDEDEDMDVENSRLSLASLPRGNIPRLTPSGPRRETEAERIFLERWGGNDESIDFGSSAMLPENPLSITRRRSRRQVDEDSEQDEL